MTEKESDQAFEVKEQLDKIILRVGAVLLEPLNQEQRDYIIDRMHDEFRFWRLGGTLK